MEGLIFEILRYITCSVRDQLAPLAAYLSPSFLLFPEYRTPRYISGAYSFVACFAAGPRTHQNHLSIYRRFRASATQANSLIRSF